METDEIAVRLERALEIALAERDLSEYHGRRDEFLDRLRDNEDQLRRKIRDALQGLEKSALAVTKARRRHRPWTVLEWLLVIASILVALVFFLLFLGRLVDLNLAREVTQLPRESGRWAAPHPFLLLTASFSAVLLLIAVRAALRRLPSASAQRKAERQQANASAELTARLTAEVTLFVRRLINEDRDAEETFGASLTTVRAPSLVELEAAHVIPSIALGEVQEFVLNHQASAIGLAGHRGSGKSTIIRSVCARDDFLGVYIPAPVVYQASGFIRMLHIKLARQLLESTNADAVLLSSQEWRSGRVQRFATSLVLFTIAVVAVLSEIFGIAEGLSSPTLVTALVTGGLGLLLYIQVILDIPPISSRLPRDTEQLARYELDTVGWTASKEKASKTTVSLISKLAFEDSSRVGAAQVERSHPELVEDLRDFVKRYFELAANAKPIVVGIDEVDKITDPTRAAEAINNLKDLFHMNRTHFLVSVSEEALNSFAARGVPVRDVFDSSFDTVVHVRRLTAEESIQLLNERVLHFPVAVALLCHAWGGGLPRDVLRVARDCVAARRRNDHPVAVVDLASTVIGESVKGALTAMLARTRDHQPGLSDEVPQERVADSLFAALRSLSEPRVSKLEQLHSSIDVCIQHRQQLETVIAYLCTAEMTLGYFSIQRATAVWEVGVKDGSLLSDVERLAACVEMLSSDPRHALLLVEEAAQHFEQAGLMRKRRVANGVPSAPRVVETD